MHLFAGAGGGLLCDLILGHQPVVAVEWDAYCCAVLRERAEQGWFPGLHVHQGDVRLFDPSEYTGRVDCIAAGFPCQDISAAGKGAGIDGARSGLFSEVIMSALIVRPRFIFLENSQNIITRGLGVVLRALAAIGFDAVWCIRAAEDVGAPHVRKRWWCLAWRSDSDSVREPQPEGRERSERGRSGDIREEMASTARNRRQPRRTCDPSQEPQWWQSDRSGIGSIIPNTNGIDADHAGHGTGEVFGSRQEASVLLRNADSEGPQERQSQPSDNGKERAPVIGADWWAVEPPLGRVVDELADRVDMLRALGNGQVAAQASAAFIALWEEMMIARRVY